MFQLLVRVLGVGGSVKISIWTEDTGKVLSETARAVSDETVPWIRVSCHPSAHK